MPPDFDVDGDAHRRALRRSVALSPVQVNEISRLALALGLNSHEVMYRAIAAALEQPLLLVPAQLRTSTLADHLTHFKPRSQSE